MTALQRRLRALTGRFMSDPQSWVARQRSMRMKAFVDALQPKPGARILDLGGNSDLWDRFTHDFHVTMVNLEPSPDDVDTPTMRFLTGDATNLGDTFAGEAFDIVFSNSVIEHVGDAKKRAALALEIRRHAPAYWVQTPCCLLSDRAALRGPVLLSPSKVCA